MRTRLFLLCLVISYGAFAQEVVQEEQAVTERTDRFHSIRLTEARGLSLNIAPSHIGFGLSSAQAMPLSNINLEVSETQLSSEDALVYDIDGSARYLLPLAGADARNLQMNLSALVGMSLAEEGKCGLSFLGGGSFSLAVYPSRLNLAEYLERSSEDDTSEVFSPGGVILSEDETSSVTTRLSGGLQAELGVHCERERDSILLSLFLSQAIDPDGSVDEDGLYGGVRVRLVEREGQWRLVFTLGAGSARNDILGIDSGVAIGANVDYRAILGSEDRGFLGFNGGLSTKTSGASNGAFTVIVTGGVNL